MSKKDKATKKTTAAVVDAAIEKTGLSNKEKRADKQNKAEVVKKITDKKDLKYHYPVECTTLSDRKKFRATTRKKIESFLKNIKSIEKGKKEGNLRSFIKEYNEFEKLVHVEPKLMEVPAKAEKSEVAA